MIPILLDCDPGHDDMMAIMLAVAADEIDLLGVTTVAGNQTGEKTYNNARRIVSFIGEKNLPVYRGADKPLLRQLRIAPEIHGVSGLDGADLPEVTTQPLPGHAVDFIIRTLMESKRPVTLVPTGPMTNIALALLKEPAIKGRIERIVFMGGGVKDSNVTPSAEFNVYVDPEAAKIVVESGVPLTMVGLDVTNRATITMEQICGITAWGGKVSSSVGKLMEFYATANIDRFGSMGAPIHDALAVATVYMDGVVRTEHVNLRIETQGEYTRGETVADLYGVTGEPANCHVAMEVDNPRFISAVLDAIREIDRRVV